MLGIKFKDFLSVKQSWIIFLMSCMAFSLISCQDSRDPNVLLVATLAGPESELVDVAAEEAHKLGLEVKVITFEDYTLPNAALADGSVDINVFQHEPFLNQTIKKTGYDLSILGRTFVFPMGVYSKTISHLKDLQEGALVAIPNDPSNGARALLLLQKAGLIQVKDNINGMSVNDITHNPKQLKFQEMDAAFLPRAMEDVSLAVINTTFALPAGLKLEDALYKEAKDSPYANLIVCRTQDNDKEAYKTFVRAMQSEAVQHKAQDLFGSSAVVAW